MKEYKIIANGTPMGVWTAEGENSVLDLFAQDAGYEDYEDLLNRVSGSSRDDLVVEEL